MKQALYQEMDFNFWLDIASRDPQAFEELRADMLAEFIDRAPAERRQRLKGLQWRIDQMRRTSGSPMGACLRIYGMMWDSLVGEEGMFSRLEQAALSTTHQDKTPPNKAKVLKLPKNS